MRPKNLVLLGIDSLRADHMSLYDYDRLTTPHIDRLARQGTIFRNAFSPSIPTTPAYASMFTGMDCFGTDVVALRHKGGLGTHVATLAEVLAERGYATTCVGFSGNPAARGFQRYIDFEGWGSFAEGRSHKAENLNAVAIPELKRLAKAGEPFFLFLRHMDPHAPYLPPQPFERIFYDRDEFDPENHSLDPVYAFRPFCDFFKTWMPPGCSDKDYIIAQYDGAIAYMDACIGILFATMQALGIEEHTLVVIDSDHGETLYDHNCYFDHHGLYECTLSVPLVFHGPLPVAENLVVDDYCQLKDLMPTALELLGIETDIAFDGRSLAPLMQGRERKAEPEFYISEATWMRKHGWRTPQWKLIHALEPDFHFKPEVELYDLLADPQESRNLASEEPGVVQMLERRLAGHIAKREQQTARRNPIYTNLDWHGQGGGAFQTSQQAYDTLYIGSPHSAKQLQAKELKTQRGADTL